MKSCLHSLQLRICIMLFVVVSVLAVTIMASAASFDCSKAVSKVEKLICDNPEISVEDNNLAEAYKYAKKYSRDSKDVVKSQKEWLKKRAKISDVSEMMIMYRNRIAELIPCEFENYSFDSFFPVVHNGREKLLAAFRGSGGAHNAAFIVSLIDKNSCDIILEEDGELGFVPSTQKGKFPNISFSVYGEEGSYFTWNGKKYIKN